jgi:arylsulfatase A-like enzyme
LNRFKYHIGTRMGQAEPPNVLWLMTDEQRTDSLGCYGSRWARTPTLDRLAREGVLFRRASTPAPICGPARTAILTGRRPAATGIWSNDQVEGLAEPGCGGHPGRPPAPLTRHFADAGYRTASFGKHHHRTVPPEAFATQADDYHRHREASERGDDDLWLAREVGYFGYARRWNQDEFDVVQYPPEPFPWILAGRFPGHWTRTAEAQVVHRAKGWLDDAGAAGRPFLLRVSFNGPHTPVAPPAPWDTIVAPGDLPDPRPVSLPSGSPPWLHDVARTAASSRLTSAQLQRARQAYYGEVAFLDWLIGDLLAWMETRGLLENLVIAFCSDHGCHLGDFGLLQKQTFFEPALNVPYIFWGPDRIASQPPVETPVGIIGLVPTLLDLAGLQPPPDLAASSLAGPLTTGTPPTPAPVFSEFSPIPEIRDGERFAAVRDGAWKLSARLRPEPDELLLVNLEDDPLEQVNRADDRDARPVRDRLVGLLATPDSGR